MYIYNLRKFDDIVKLLLQAGAVKGVGSSVRGVSGIRSVDDLLELAGDAKYLSGSGQTQLTLRGHDIDEVWDALIKKGNVRPSGAVELSDGIILSRHQSSSTGVSTIVVNSPDYDSVIKIRFPN